jgi:1-phosphofructokinase
MIYTVTLNPAIDYVMEAESFNIGQTNRSLFEYSFVGGKGINVSTVLKNFGMESIAMGITAGFTGLEIERMTEREGIKTSFVRTEGKSRINVKIKHGCETEINGSGPVVTGETIENLYRKISFLKKGDWLVLSGNAPLGVDKNVYAEFIRRANGARCVLDASGALFSSAVREGVFFVKPNVFEAEEITGIKTENNRENVMRAARELKKMGAENVMVTMGRFGAAFSGEEDEFFVAAPDGDVVNTVGSGDSAVAGFIYAKEMGFDERESVAFAVAAGSAGAFSKTLPTLDETKKLFENMTR